MKEITDVLDEYHPSVAYVVHDSVNMTVSYDDGSSVDVIAVVLSSGQINWVVEVEESGVKHRSELLELGDILSEIVPWTPEEEAYYLKMRERFRRGPSPEAIAEAIAFAAQQPVSHLRRISEDR